MDRVAALQFDRHGNRVWRQVQGSAFEADDWARSEAMPSEEEIRRVRRLISQVKADLDDLTAEDRAQIEEAVAVVRRGRTVLLGMPQPRVQHGLLDARPWRSV
ncbi:transposase [Kitasatospora griseola]|uniref:transposase n=1 Tax=Kitasatospora griseola TaxID=2064 RepID=UPI0036DF0F60